ncbi:MAG: phage major capsid protein [Candidatus Izemoplasmatales bacterium]
MDVVEQIKGLIGDLKKEVASKDAAINSLSERLDKVVDVVEKLDSKGSPIGFESESKGREFMKWVNDLASNKALTEGVPADGGYTVPEQFVPELIRLIEEYGYIRRFATRIPMNTNSLTMPSLTTGVTVNWVDEANAIPETQPTFSQVNLTNKKLAALVPISTELLDDSSLTMANLILQLIAEGLGNEEDRVGFVGNTAQGDPFNGILNLPGATSIVMPTGSTSFTDINPDLLLDMTDAVPRSARRNASFFINREVLNVIRKLKNANDDYIVQRPTGTNFTTIWGYPVIDLDVMPPLSDDGASKPFVIFGDPKYMYMADRQNVTFARSIHYAFNMDVTYIRATERIGFQSGLPQAFSRLVTAAT